MSGVVAAGLGYVGLALAMQGQRFRFVELANDINSQMPDYLLRHPTGAKRARAAGQGIPDPAAGTAFKSTGDPRESPAVRIHDQLVTEPTLFDTEVVRVGIAPEKIAATDLDQHSRYVLDCRWVLSGPNV